MSDVSSARKIGLARALSKLGYCSRSSAVHLIRAGRVSLNGSVRRDPETPVAGPDPHILVDGRAVEASRKVYFMLHKPSGVLTTARDERGRDTVYTLLNPGWAEENGAPGPFGWLAPVGRLDKASEGLLLLTNDSEWAAQVAAPGTHLDKTYHVQVATIADEQFVVALGHGVKAKDGEILRAKQARRLRAGQKNCWLEIILDEGKNRQIRRMMEAMDVEVLRLMRVAIGPLQLGELPKGGHRALTAEEKQRLDRAMRQRHE